MIWRRILHAEALLFLAWASWLNKFASFDSVMRFGSLNCTCTKSGADFDVRQFGRIVESVGNRVHFRAVCIEQGAAAQRMLRRRGFDAILHYGIGKSEQGALVAHVWVTLGGNDVVGGSEAHRFAEVAQFPRLNPDRQDSY